MVATSGSETSLSGLNKVPVLKGEETFHFWKEDFETFLRMKDLFRYVEDDIEKPVKPENFETLTADQKNKFEKKLKTYTVDVSTIWMCLRQALDVKYISILDLVAKGDVKNAWAAIHARFGVSNSLPNQLNLIETFNAIKMKTDGTSLVDSFNNCAAEIENTYSRLVSFGIPYPVQLKLGRLIAACSGVKELYTFCQDNLVHQLGTDYAGIHKRILDRVHQLDRDAKSADESNSSKTTKRSLETAESVATLVKTVNKLSKNFKNFKMKRNDAYKNRGRSVDTTEKKHDSDSDEDEDESSYSAKKQKVDHSTKTCYRCGKLGHISTNCPTPRKKKNGSNLAIDSDNERALDEYERVEELDAFSGVILADAEQGEDRCTNCSSVNHVMKPSCKVFIMDSGSNKTHVAEKGALTSYKKTASSVVVANGDRVKTHGVGKIGSLDASHTELSSNLLSIGQLADAGYHTTFTKTHAVIKNAKTDETVCRGKRIENGLYFIDSDAVSELPVLSESVAMLASTRPLKSVDAAHARTHLPDSSIRKASKLVDGLIDVTNKGSFYHNPSLCSTCALTKITRRSFKRASHRPTPSKLFEVVSSDLSGRITPMGRGGVHYLILFVCERSRYKHLYFLSTKDQALEKLKVFKSQGVEAYGFKLSELFTDGGGEFEGEFDDYCVANAIVHKTTSPYTPEENSTTEVYWRTLMGMVRAFLKASVLPANMWPWTAKHANFILNRMLPVTLDGVTKTPYEWRFNLRPNLKHLRVWGCECFYKVNVQVKKLDDRGRAGYYVGVDPNSRSALILDKETNKFVKSGHVIFNEVIEKRMEVDSGESIERIKLGTLQRGSGAETVIEEVPFFSFADLDMSEDELFGSTMTEPAVDHDVSDEEDGVLDSRFYDEEPDEMYWQAEKLQKTRSGRSVTKPVSFAVIQNGGESKLLTPSTYTGAMECVESTKWKLSIAEEYDALDSNDTWYLAVLPKGVKPLKSKWVFKIKTDEDGKPVRYKSRLTIKGYVQRHGIDYWETFSPVAKLISLRLFFAIATQFNMNLFQMDVNNAFLNAELKENIYMELPEGYDLESFLEGLPSDHEVKRAGVHVVLKLNKSLYGLKQAPREWYLNVSSFLKRIGYEQLAGDACLFVKRKDKVFSMVALYVDDLVIASTSVAIMKDDVRLFNAQYKMKNIGKPELIVGLNVERDVAKGTLKLSQHKYVHELLKRFKMEDAKVASTSADYNVKLTKDMCPKSDEEKKKVSKYPYRELIGCLMYLSVGTRPDISFAVSELSKYLANPGKAHWTAALHVLRYLKGTAGLGITFTRSGGSPVVLKAYSDFQYNGPSNRSLRLEAYSDADWGGDKDTRRSHTGGVLFLAGGAISWISKKQNSVAMSSAEAEYMSASLVCREVIWIRSLLTGLGFKQPGPTVMHEDNAACVQMSKNPVLHSKTKHIDLHYHFVRERVESGEVRLDWISTEDMIADLLTKALLPNVFMRLRDALFGTG